MHSLGLRTLAPHIAAHPFKALIIATLLTIICAYLMVTQTRFTGDITENLRSDSPHYQDFRELEKAFHPFSKDETLLIRTTDLGETETYEQFQSFLLDLQLADQVEAAFSIFSLPSLTPYQPDAGPQELFFLTQQALAAQPPADRLVLLLEKNPLARKMLAQDRSATIISLSLIKPSDGTAAKLHPENRQAILTLAKDYEEHFELSFVGIPQIQRTIRETLNKDQTKLTIASTLVCILMAWLIFRSWRGALICALPPVVGLVWHFGFLAAFSIPIDFLTTIVPTMVLVVAFADGVHLYMSILRYRDEADSMPQSIARAIASTGPACFLASLTTSLAFVGIGLGGAETMHRLALTGAVGIMLAFASVIFVLPTLAYFLLPKTTKNHYKPSALLTSLSGPAITLVTRFRFLVLAGSILASIGLVTIHTIIPASFQVTDYLAEDVQIRQDEVFIEQKLGGTGQLFAIIKDADGKKGLAEADKTLLQASITSLNRQISVPLPHTALTAFMQAPDLGREVSNQALMRRFVSRDGLSYLVPLPLGTMLTAQQIGDYTDRIKEQLEADHLSDKVRLTGLSLLTAKETPRLIEDLRTGLISAIGIVILAIMLIVRSVRVGLACLLPNLIPILTVEAYFWIIDKPINMTAVVALTIAFGIAVDNSVHLLNQYQLAKRIRARDAMPRAIATITPAVLSTTALLLMGLTMTQFSALPSIALFGQLVFTALLVALLADLFILPSFLLALERKQK